MISAPSPIRFGNAEVRPSAREVLLDGRPAAIGARALDVLLALIERRERVVSKHELLDLVWPGLVVEENNLQVHISALRKLLGPQPIATIPGRGYRFTAQLAESDASDSRPAPSPATSAAAAASQLPEDPPTNLPARQVHLIGREADVTAVAELLLAHALVSIVGAGGIGKTRLAQTVAHEQRRAFTEGVWWVDLAPINDPAGIVSAVAQAIGATGSATPATAKSVASALRRGRVLLVIDNCEHLLDGATELAGELLRDCPELHILVTSQELLRLPGEQAFRLGGLAVPRADEAADASAGAVALFIERAHAADRRMQFDSDALNTVATICRDLDGIPLAIELAAARAPLLGLRGLRDRLQERFSLLTGGSRMALRRHQTLRAALDWSHGLLSDDERKVFRRLGVFTGGFSLPLAQAVVADERIDQWTALDLLAHLVEKSLVTTDAHNLAGEPRYRLLETARAYALEQLNAAGETRALLRRHAQALHDLLLPFYLRVGTFPPAAWAIVGAELDNLRSAHDWSMQREGDRALGCALLSVSVRTWWANGQLLEGVERCLLQLKEPMPAEIEARLQLTVARLGYLTSRADCLEAARRAAELCRQLGDPLSEGDALLRLVLIGTRRGLNDETDAALAAAEHLAQPDWPPMQRGLLALARATRCLRLDDIEGALAAAWQQVQCNRDGQSAIGVQMALSNVATHEFELGHRDAAVERLEGVAAELRRLDPRGTHLGATLGQLCAALGVRNGPGDAERALDYGRESWPLLRRLERANWVIESMGVAHARYGAGELGVRLIGFAQASRIANGEVFQPAQRRMAAGILVDFEETYGQDRVKAWLGAGARLDEDAAIALAFGAD